MKNTNISRRYHEAHSRRLLVCGLDHQLYCQQHPNTVVKDAIDYYLLAAEYILATNKPLMYAMCSALKCTVGSEGGALLREYEALLSMKVGLNGSEWSSSTMLLFEGGIRGNIAEMDSNNVLQIRSWVNISESQLIAALIV